LFAAGHVFTYSSRPGTVAARMKPHIPHPIRKARNAQMRQAFARSADAYRMRFVNATLPVLWESAKVIAPNGWELSGLTDNYLRVVAHAPQELWNQITLVRMIGVLPDGLTGEISIGNDEVQPVRNPLGVA